MSANGNASVAPGHRTKNSNGMSTMSSVADLTNSDSNATLTCCNVVIADVVHLQSPWTTIGLLPPAIDKISSRPYSIWNGYSTRR